LGEALSRDSLFSEAAFERDLHGLIQMAFKELKCFKI